MKELKFIKSLGLGLIALGLVIAVASALYMSTHPEISFDVNATYKVGLIGGTAIGMSLSGGLLRLYSAANS